MKVYLDEGAFAPTRAYGTDAGLDLYSPCSVLIPAHESKTIDTGVHIELPPNTFGKLESKSGLNVRHDIVSCGGVIDEGYTGSIKAKLYNFGDEDYLLEAGMKIVQLIVQPCLYVPVEVVTEWNNNTERGDNGFGSTGR